MGETGRLTQSEKALIGLRSLLMSGGFAANERLPEIALSKRLGISRTPLRHAMDQLVNEGLLERIDSGGCRVASFSIEDIVDAIEIRGVIEGTAARLAAERGVDASLMAEADDILAALDVALAHRPELDFDAYIHHNARFHDLIARLPGSPVIRREVDRASLLPLASPSAFLQEQEFIPDFRASLARAQHQHHEIIVAIRSREGTRAEALTREHARLARINFEYVLDKGSSIVPRVPGLALVASP
jgi:GntR family transcriptional regulator, vanillate catabolism transcriptional regulator